MRPGLIVAFAVLSAAACATTSGTGPSSAPAVPSGVTFSGGDGLSCETRVVVHAKNELAGVQAEYAWLAAKYPGYQRGVQSLAQCDERPADKIQIRTRDGRELVIHFDISEFFGTM